MKLKKLSTTLCLLSLLTLATEPSLAITKTPDGFPKGCRAIGFSFTDKQLLLTPTNEESDNQSLYLIHNISSEPLTVRAKDENAVFVGMDWKMDLQPSLWSSFATDKEKLQFQCQRPVANDGDEPVSLDCESVLAVCEYNKAMFGEGQMGTYWVITNKSLEGSVHGTIKKGILLRW